MLKAELLAVRLSYEPNKVTVDATASRKSIELLTPNQFMRETAHKGRSMVRRGIKKRVAMGDKLAAIEKGYTVGRVIKEVYGPAEKVLSVDTVRPPRVHFQPTRINLEFTPRGRTVNFLG